MTEIDNQAKKSLVNPATDGLVVARVDVTASIGMNVDNARAGGRASLIMVSSKAIHSSSVHKALDLGGHSKKIVRGKFYKLVPPDGQLENTLQEMPDGTSIHIAEETAMPDLLNEAPKPALMQNESVISLSKRVSRRFVMNIFTTAEELPKYPGLSDFIHEDDKELKTAA